jgi:pyruvate dehydrogenase E1 component alpha subunit
MAESAATDETKATPDDQSDEAGVPSLDAELGEKLLEDLGEDRLVGMFENMTLIRRFEEQAGRSYQRGKIKGFCHLYTGQEAVATGAMWAIEDHDYIVAAYREHGHAIARGLDPDAVMAELFGKKTGVSKGKGGSMHLFDVDKNFYGGWGIVGGQIPTATGVAFASKYREEDAVCLCFFGEGSIHQGVFHESLNMASVMDLPVVYIIENNKYAMGTAIDRISAVTELDKKAVSYDMEGARIEDGQDIFKVYDGLKEAVDRARDEQRPTLVEVRTYRYKGHSMSDPATYRTKEEVEEAQKRDPIQRFTHWLMDNDVRTQDELSEIDERMKSRAKEAVKFADDSDFPDADELTTDIYVDWPADID